ncbi:MAG TPA: ABC transporter permease [candidate division Zixibacteria bacterium]|nr:ABC transporter permease subunit [candidate division Zixibacteria bacterium]MDD4917674.1 ABC transporter permease [candidate division Zixibacteria bacterium]MDM7974078.1 ABC transporter permease [candidate division Zixibacteria bacterium]HOD65565.1 ABC transporter permease [candidate division Zixibacteria bacterium]HOZ06675.1 ABC transporter permease [candidate division Zixibacteria bacterium]
MTALRNVTWFVVKDIVRSRWSLVNTLFFAAATAGLFYLQADAGKAAVSLSSLCLVFVPLISLLYPAMYYYSAREFVELILTQPVGRRAVYLGLFAGIFASLWLGFALGIGVPYLVLGGVNAAGMTALAAVLLVGTALGAIFTGLALVAAVRFDDRGKGLAVVLGIWLTAAIGYDGAVLAAATAFAAYPLETPLLAAALGNPVDLARVLLLIHSDMAALMGYTGAVFMRFFDRASGLGLAAAVLTLWAAAPVWYGIRRFARKDF